MRLMGRDFALSSHWMKILKVSFSLIIPHTELRLPDGLDETNCFMIKTNKHNTSLSRWMFKGNYLDSCMGQAVFRAIPGSPHRR